jgi:hypothetical protein
VHGDRFIIGESQKIQSFDELRRLLHEEKAATCDLPCGKP